MTPVVAVLAVAALGAGLLAPVTAPGTAALLGLVALVLAVAAARVRRPTLLVVLVAALVVTVAAGLRLHRLTTGPLAGVAARAGAAEVVVQVVGEPDRRERDRWRADVRVLDVAGHRSGRRAVLTASTPLTYGARYAGTVEVRPVATPWRRHRHLAVSLRAAELDPVGPPGAVAAGTTALRTALAAAAAAALPPGHAGLATGLVTGDTSLLPADDEAAMRATGLTHLTAVSGSNVALVVAGTWLVAGAVGLGARGRRRTAVVVVVLFAVLTRADPSVLRASAMAGLALLAAARGRRTQPVQLLAAAVLVLVLLDPLLARRLGLLLSASATLGVLVVAPRVRQRLDPLLAVVRSRRVLDLLAVTVGAQVAVLPVLLATGDEIALATLPANLVAVPAAALASVACTTAAVVALPAPALASGLLGLARPPLGVVLGVARRLQWWGPVVGIEEPVVLLGVLGGIGWLLLRAGAVRRSAAAVAALSAAVALLPAPVTDGAFVLTAIDVGQGDAFLLTSHRASVLVDAGRDGRAAAWLRRHGHRRLDLLVLTHADEDHAGGAADVLGAVGVGAVWQRPREEVPPPALGATLAAAAAAAVPVHAPHAGQRARVGDLDLRVLAPAGARAHLGLDGQENESSLVLRVDGPGGAVLLTGDIGPAAHAALLGDPATLALLDVDVLTVPHHGSADVDLALHAAASARHAVVSVGADNRYGHPAPAVLEAVGRSGARLHRTDQDGTVRVVVTGSVPGDARVHAGDLRRPVAAATGDRPRARGGPRRRRRRTDGRRRGGAARRPHDLPVRRRQRARPALRPRAQRGRAGRGASAGGLAGRHPRGRGRRALVAEPAQDAARPRGPRRCARGGDAAPGLGRRAVGPAGR